MKNQSVENNETPEKQHSKFDAVNAIKQTLGDQLSEWAARGVKCSRAFFHQPVPRMIDKTPSNEFRLVPSRNDKGEAMRVKNGKTEPIPASDLKYFVDSIVYTPYGVIWECEGEMNIAPLANVSFARSIR